MDVRDDTAAGDRRLDQRVELLVTADGELQVARGDALDLEVLGGVAGELEDLGGEVLCWRSAGGWWLVVVVVFVLRWICERAGRGFFFFFFFESSFAENEGRWPLSLLSPSLFARLSLSLSLARARKRPSSLCSRECFERPLPPKERGGERALPLSLSSPRSRTMAAKNSTMFFFPPSRDKAKTPPPSPPSARVPSRENAPP